MIKRILTIVVCFLTWGAVSHAQVIPSVPTKMLIEVSSIWGVERAKFQANINTNAQALGATVVNSTVARSPNGNASFEVEIVSDASKVANFLILTAEIAPKAIFKLHPYYPSFNIQEFEIIEIETSQFRDVLVSFLRMGVLPTSISQGVISFESPMNAESVNLLVALKGLGLNVVNKGDHSPAKVRSGYIYHFSISLSTASKADSFTKKLISRYEGFEFVKSAREGGEIVVTYRLVINPKQINPETESKRILSNLKKWKDVKSVGVTLVGRANVTIPRPDIRPRPPIEVPRPEPILNPQSSVHKKASITIRPKQRVDAEAILEQLKTVPGILTGEVVEFRSFNIVLVEVDATLVDQVLSKINNDSRVLRASRSPERQLLSSAGDTQSQVSALDIARTNAETASILAEITCRQFFSR